MIEKKIKLMSSGQILSFCKACQKLESDVDVTDMSNRNYQIDGKTGTWLPYDSEVVEGVCFFMMRNVITSTTMLYYGQLFVKI